MAQTFRRTLSPAVIAVAAVIAAGVLAATNVQPASSTNLDVPYVPTPQPVVDRMLELASIQPNDYLIDLGSGDGRIAITAAAKYGVDALGVDIDPKRIAEARQNAEKQKVADKATFKREDLFQTDLSKANVVTMYLLSDVNMKLKPKLMKLRPGTRIVSHRFDLGDWKPDRTEVVDGRTIYMWTVTPASQTKGSAPSATK